MKKITLINNNIKFRIDEWVIDRIPMERYEVEEFFSELTYMMEQHDKDFTLEDIQDMAYDYIYEYADECLPIYNHEIMEIFGGLDHWEIDEVVQESGWIEYTPEDGFISFAKAVIGKIKADEVGRALSVIFEEAEFIKFEREAMEEVKRDILNYLNTTKDLELEKRINKYLKGQEASCESVLHYIAEIYYISEDGEVSKTFNVFIDNLKIFINDEDIKEAIKNY